jgi:ABC-2 type transport system permease protein
MLRLFYKEVGSFFDSLIGILTVSVFLTINGLFLWVFPGNFNLTAASHAGLEGLFSLGPYVFLFLVPAITMRSFSEESRAGTMEWLLTKPLSDMQIVWAKYLAGVVLLVASLLPTLVYLVTLNRFSLPPGPDMGGIWGSYLGLLFLGAAFVAIGLFASSLTGNQIVSFILAMFMSGFAFIGFDMIAALPALQGAGLFVSKLGVQSHYASMSRGVVDTRDLLYFISLIALFLLMIRIRLESRHWLTGSAKTIRAGGRKGKARHHLLVLFAGLGLIAAANFAGSWRFARLDLTSEQRHTLSPATKDMLQALEEPILVRVYLEGNLPAGLRNLRNQTREMLEEFSAYTNKLQFELVNPLGRGGGRLPDHVLEGLVERGMHPTQVQVQAGDATSLQMVFPWALVAGGGQDVPVSLLSEQMGLPAEQVLNHSARALEYKLGAAIRTIAPGRRDRIGFLEGKGTLEPRYVADLTRSLSDFYDVGRVRLDAGFERLRQFRTLVVAQPRDPFSEADKYLLDQYLMHGGTLLWLVDPVIADMDSLQDPPHETIALAANLHLEDLFFRYGLRLNHDLLMDLNAASLGVTTGSIGGRPQIRLMPWPYFPLAGAASGHPVVRNLDLVRTEFVSSIEAVEAAGVHATPLLQTSPYTRVVPTPARIALDQLEAPQDQDLYSGPARTIAMLLEGRFQSVFQNRIPPGELLPAGLQPLQESLPTAMIVVSDGDLIRNQFGSGGQVLPLGYDRMSGEMFGNGAFILNAVNYLTGDKGLIAVRSREVSLRLLDKTALSRRGLQVRLLNLLLPVLLVVVPGLVRGVWRKRRYKKA